MKTNNKTMKHALRIGLSLILTLALFSSCSKDDDNNSESNTVAIPDTSFEQALIDQGIDTNGLNGNILKTDAEAVTELSVEEKNISSLEGIQAFTNLKDLECHDNNIASLDISDNLKLKSISGEQNQLTHLDISKNLELEYLNISENSLTSIDVSNNLDLIGLYCSNNLLTNIDVANNINLAKFNCSDNLLSNINITNNLNLNWLKVSHNQLTELDLSEHDLLAEFEGSYNQLTSLKVKNGNNTSLIYFTARSNSNLYCIEVDDAIWSNVNWSNGIDGLTAFSENCN